ncbi:MAG: hypothetical protein FWD72_02075 [Eggerthellaceae bacterium]|nr:hypothetical protein [Eggerthellaceae bacterium]
MPTLTIRKIDDDLKEGLKRLAQRDGRSVEGYVRNLLYQEVSRNTLANRRDLAGEIHRVMAAHQVYLSESDLKVHNEIPRSIDL